MSTRPETVDTAPASDPAGLQHGDDAVGLPPLLTVTKGNPTPEELAALTAVVAALRSSGQAGSPSRRARRPRRPLLRPFVSHGPGAWRHTFR
jgi:hypothetical protein